ncbi:hypothetical protein KC19_5G023700 [Ceratodon purpureus]|uniref:Uncharacterized protein n=1 Tax=Ceratodon purpureus TaxID=3225 RepID=A0A8T0HX47_CERPU|nr:hypothetical protein KC19_5G023700 [Ceratodon purpureus]
MVKIYSQQRLSQERNGIDAGSDHRPNGIVSQRVLSAKNGADAALENIILLFPPGDSVATRAVISVIIGGWLATSYVHTGAFATLSCRLQIKF